MRDTFQILRYGSVLSQETILAAAPQNLVVNPGAETGDTTGWASGAVGDYAGNPILPPMGKYYFYNSGATNRMAVVTGARYYAGFTFGILADCRQDHFLFARVRFWTAGVGGSEVLPAVVLYDGRVPRTGLPNLVAREVKIPATATHATLDLVNTVSANSNPRYLGLPIRSTDVFEFDNVFLQALVSSRWMPLIERIRWSPADKGGPGFSNLNYSHSDRGGFTAARFLLRGAPEYLNDWLERGLGQHISIVYGSYGQVWEGMIYGLSGTIGGVSYGNSLDSLINDVYLRYPTYNAYDSEFIGASRAEDAVSILRYGRKQMTERFDSWMDSVDGDAVAMQLLKQARYPRPLSLEALGSAEPDGLEVECTGYWSTLGWIKTNVGTRIYGNESPTYDTSVLAATGDGVTDTDADGRPDAPYSALASVRKFYGNGFISENYRRVYASGVLVGEDSRDSQWRTATGSWQQFVIDMADRGDSSQKRVVCGVEGKQQFVFHARPTEVAYHVVRDRQGALVLRDQGGAPCDPALLKAGNFVRFAQAHPTFVHATDPMDDPNVSYVAEYTFDAEQGTGTPVSIFGEPIDALILKS